LCPVNLYLIVTPPLGYSHRSFIWSITLWKCYVFVELNSGDVSILNKILHQKLVTTKNDIEIQHKDPKSPLYSVKSFEALHL